MLGSQVPERSPGKSRFRRPLPFAAIPALIAAVVGSVIAFQTPTDSRSVAGDPNLRDGIRIHVNVVKVIPDADHLVVRMSFEPVGSFVKDRHFLTKPVRVVIVAGAAVVDEAYEAGEIMPPEDVELALEWDIAEFPIDRYDGMFQVNVWSKEKKVKVPSVILADASVHGYTLTAEDPVSEIDGGHDMTIAVQRSTATLVFGFFVMSLMWALTILALAMAVAEIHRKGVLSDFAAYFWCEILLGLTLVSVLAIQAKRKIGQHRDSPG